MLTKYLPPQQFTKFLIFFLLFGISLLLILKEAADPPSNQIIPGTTNTETFLNQQSPYTTVNKPTETEYYVGDPNSRNNSTYIEKNGIIEYFLQRDKTQYLYTDYQDYLDHFGQPDLIRYNDWSTYSKFEVHVFLKPGIALTLHPDSKESIIEEWHLTKNLSPELFDANYYNLFSKTPPTPANQL
ncbi:MAG TPA: hypothetical protein VN226_02305 [Anaerolineales bacterium]|nr:hypothetical protein [Anaerolineales bacterium]